MPTPEVLSILKTSMEVKKNCQSKDLKIWLPLKSLANTA